MTVKTLAVALFSPEEAEWLAPAAAELAAALDAHLIGVFPSEPVAVYGGMGMEPVILNDLMELRADEAGRIGTAFAEAARRSGINSEFRAQEGALFGAETFLLSCLRAADMIVASGASRETDAPAGARLREIAVRQSGRPALVMPKAAPLARTPQRLLVGWSNTRESARAAHDAMALAAPGAEFDLLAIRHSIEAEGRPADSRDDLAAALDRHGFRVNLLDRDATAVGTGEALVTAAQERGADVIVTGAYGHSQLYDFVIGAVTSHLLENTPLPVLLSK